MLSCALVLLSFFKSHMLYVFSTHSRVHFHIPSQPTFSTSQHPLSTQHTLSTHPLFSTSSIRGRSDDRGSCALRPRLALRHQMQQLHPTCATQPIGHGDITFMFIMLTLPYTLTYTASHIFPLSCSFTIPYNTHSYPIKAHLPSQLNPPLSTQPPPLSTQSPPPSQLTPPFFLTGHSPRKSRSRRAFWSVVPGRFW